MSSVWVCESARNVLTSTTGDRIELPGTYLRGLAFDGDAFYTASSKRRMFSKSEDGDGAYEGTCGLYRTSGAPLGAPRETEMIAEFHDRTAEIYDLLILPQR